MISDYFYIIHFHIWLSTQSTSKFWKVLSALKGLNVKPKWSYSVKDQPDLGQPLRKKALLQMGLFRKLIRSEEFAESDY